jgi:hypothetical protein
MLMVNSISRDRWIVADSYGKWNWESEWVDPYLMGNAPIPGDLKGYKGVAERNYG